MKKCLSNESVFIWCTGRMNNGDRYICYRIKINLALPIHFKNKQRRSDLLGAKISR